MSKILAAIAAYQNNMQLDENLNIVDMRSLTQRQEDFENMETRRLSHRGKSIEEDKDCGCVKDHTLLWELYI